ncbi:MAG: TonB family protein [Acidobacteriota bacterium]
MPLKVRRFYTSIFLVLFSFAAAAAQTLPAQTPPTGPQTTAVPVKAPTSAEVMRDRISKAKAFIAVRNYSAAIYELENIRRESGDASVNAVTNVLLMNSYLEQGDYKRADDLLTEFYNGQKLNKPNALAYYSAVASQIIKGARNQAERYRALGLTVSDRNLPLEAVNDIERMRESLELVITQAKDLSKDKTKSDMAMALIEEATNSRSLIARDDYDARRWKDELGDSREQIANSRSVIINAVDGTSTSAAGQQTVAENTSDLATKTVPAVNNPAEKPEIKPAFQPVSEEKKIEQPPVKAPQVALNTAAGSEQKSGEPQRNRVINGDVAKNTPETGGQKAQPKTEPQPSAAGDTGPLEVGSLIGYATKQQAPVYPIAAKNMRTTGVVKVELTVDEKGEVAEVQNMSGPILLQTAARDAVRKWKFKPFVRDGQPVKAIGFVNFSFTL